MIQNPLIGKTIKTVWLAEDNKTIKFDLADGTDIIARCDGDCCSSTWIENVENPEALIGAEVMGAVDIPMPDLSDQCPNRDVVRFYGFKISTPKGDCVIDYRNESNGYYGGNLSWPTESYFYGGVYGQNVSNEKWTKPVAWGEVE